MQHPRSPVGFALVPQGMAACGKGPRIDRKHILRAVFRSRRGGPVYGLAGSRRSSEVRFAWAVAAQSARQGLSCQPCVGRRCRRYPGWPRCAQARRPRALAQGGVRAGYAGHSRWEPRCALIRGGDGVLAVMCPAASPGRPFHALNGTELSVRLSVASIRPRKHERSDCVRPYLSQSPRAGCLLVVRYWPPAAVAPCKFTRATQIDTSTSQVGYEWDGEDAGKMINKVVGSRRFATQAAWRMSCLPS